MAETIEGLYLRIGLKYDELNQDFVAIEETLSSNVQRLNRQQKLIELKAKIDLTGVTDEEQKLQIQQRALNQHIEIAQQKLRLYESAWMGAVKANGTASTQAQQAELALKQQQLTLARLSQSLKEVTAKQKVFADAEAKTSKFNSSLLGRYTNIKGDVGGAIGQLTSAFSGLQEASSSADSAITKSLEIIDSIPSPVGKVVAAFAAIPLVVKGVENSLLGLADPAISAGDSMYVLSRGLQMSFADAAKFNMICKVTGIEVSEVVATIRRLQTQIVKASSSGSTLTKMLQKYGVDARNANGELKDINELSLALSEGLTKAQAAGKSREFISGLGRGVSGDFITYLEDLSGNIDLAASVVKHGLADPARAHNVAGNMNAMNAQAAQLSSAFSNSLLPIADVIVPKITARTGELVKIVEQNASRIKDLGFAVADVVDNVSALTTEIVKLGIESTKYLKNPNAISVNEVLSRHKNDAEELQNYSSFIEAELQQRTELRKQALMQDGFIFKGLDEKEATKRAEAEKRLIENNPMLNMQFQTQLKASWNKVKDFWKDQAEATERAAKEKEEAAKSMAGADSMTAEEMEESLSRIQKYQEELSKVKLDLQFGDNTYGKSLAELGAWYQNSLAEATKNEEERLKVSELYAAKRAQIEKTHNAEIEKAQQEVNDRIQNLTQETANIEYERTHSAYEKQLHDIEQWKKAQLEKAKTAGEVSAIISNAAAKETQAFQNEMDRIRGNIQSLSEKIFEQTHSQRDIDIMRAQKQRAEYLEQGNPAELVSKWYHNEIAKIAATTGEDYKKAPDLSGGANVPDFYSSLQRKVDEETNKFQETKKPEEILGKASNAVVQSLDKLHVPVQGFGEGLQNAQSSIGTFSDAINAAGEASTTVTRAFQQAADNIEGLTINPPQKDFSQNSPLEKSLPTKEISQKTLSPKDNSSINKQLGTKDKALQQAANKLKQAISNKKKESAPLPQANFDKKIADNDRSHGDEQSIFNDIFKNARAGFDDIKQSLSKATLSTLGFETANSDAESATEKLSQSFKNIADTTINLDSAINNISSAFNKDVDAVKNLNSAADKFATELSNLLDVPQQKTEPNNNAPNVPINPTPAEPVGKEIKSLTTDISALQDKFSELGNATDNLSADINSLDFDSLNAINDSAEKAAQQLLQVDSTHLKQSVTEIENATAPLANKFSELDTALDSVVNSLQQSAEKLASVTSQQATQPPLQEQSTTPNNSAHNSIIDQIFNTSQDFIKNIPVLGTIMQAETDIIKQAVEKIDGITQQIHSVKDNEVQQPISEVSFDNFNSSIDTAGTKVTDFSNIVDATINKLQGKDFAPENKSLSQFTPQEKSLPTNNPARDTASLQQAVDKLKTAILEHKAAPPTTTAPLSSYPAKLQDTTQLTDSLSAFSTAIKSVGSESNSIAAALQQVSDKISKQDFQQPTITTPATDIKHTEQPTIDFSAIDTLSADIRDFNNQTQQKLSEMIQAITNYAKDIPAQTPAPNEPLQLNLDALQTAANSASSSLAEFDLSLKNATTNFSTPADVQPFTASLPTFDFTPLQSSFESFNFELDNAKNTVSDFSFALQDSVNKLNQLPTTAGNTPAFSFDTTVFNQMTQQLVSLTQTAGTIAQNVSAIQQQRQQPPQITVSPNINIDLGGAYVFDNSMKQKLTDDITSEVANAITDAVSTATSRTSYGYGN